MLLRRAFVLMALAGCLPRSNRSEGDAPPPEPPEPPDDEPKDGSAPRPSEPAPAPASPPPERLAKGPGELPPRQTYDAAIPPTPENLEARAAALRERYGPHGLTVLVERPFVLVGNQGLEALRRRAEGTVRWAVHRLEQDYFDAAPLDIVEVWLLGDDQSYRAHAVAVLGEQPDTPYGYFTPKHQVLIMNIATGGGTLVHELVHPFVDNDFPECPSWLNEGLASLYEQCSDHDGHIWGLTNWRLPGLQETIEAGRLPSFGVLLSTTRDQFYEDDPGSNYAQARYLCMYLQEMGQLQAFYRDFRRDVGHDPTGLATLRGIVGEDMPAFQRHWEQWVLTLRFG